MRSRLLVLAAGLLAACNGAPATAQDPTPFDRAGVAFGPEHDVQFAGLHVPGAEAFVAYPLPFRYDYDGFEAVLIPDDGLPLHGASALRFVWDSGERDPDTLARAAALFVGDSQQVAGLEHRTRTHLANHERIEAPTLRGTTLTCWVVRGSMRQVAAPVTVDFAALPVTTAP
jgi:hypothetical protein